MKSKFTLERKPDRTYGMSYPYEKLFRDGALVLEKFPFSCWFGKIVIEGKAYSVAVGRGLSITVWLYGHGLVRDFAPMDPERVSIQDAYVLAEKMAKKLSKKKEVMS